MAVQISLSTFDDIAMANVNVYFITNMGGMSKVHLFSFNPSIPKSIRGRCLKNVLYV